jgi:hypothetical protein
MGLLDDAIREHLELKRRHGADPSEVARQENEALGPPRRSPATEEHELAGATALRDDELDDDLPAAEAVPQAPPSREPEADDPPAPSRPTGEPEAPVSPPAPVEEPPRRSPGEDAEGHDDPGSYEDPRTQAHDDVLEETPDFLQETPEHDRLWFEQKPPKDFDF